MDSLLYFSVVYSATFLLYRRYTHVYRLFMYHQQIILSGACFKSTVDAIIKPLCKTVCGCVCRLYMSVFYYSVHCVVYFCPVTVQCMAYLCPISVLSCAVHHPSCTLDIFTTLYVYK